MGLDKYLDQSFELDKFLAIGQVLDGIHLGLVQNEVEGVGNILSGPILNLRLNKGRKEFGKR